MGRRFSASSTSAAMALMRRSALFPAVSPCGSRNCQPRSWQAACQTFESPPNSTRRGDLWDCAAAGTARIATRTRISARWAITSVYQPRVNPFGQFLNFFGLLQAGYRKHVAIVLFQLLLQLFGQLNELCRVLQVPFVIGLQDFILLGFAVGKRRIGIDGGWLTRRPHLRRDRRRQGPRQACRGCVTQQSFHGWSLYA